MERHYLFCGDGGRREKSIIMIVKKRKKKTNNGMSCLVKGCLILIYNILYYITQTIVLHKSNSVKKNEFFFIKSELL